MERLVLVTFLLALMKEKVDSLKRGLRQATNASRSWSRFLLNCLAPVIAIAVSATGATGELSIGSKPSSSNPVRGSASDSSTTSTGVLNSSTSDSKSGKADPEALVGHASADVESTLGKPTGKLQTPEGALWLYADWRVQFGKEGQVLKVEKDQPVHLAKVDPRFSAAADAVSRAAAARAAADDEARIKAALPPVEDIRSVSNGGQEVDLPSLLAENKITIVDFYAEWCVPCQRLSPKLEQLAKDDPDVVLLKVDIVNWNTPVTQQFGIHSVPNVRVFNRSKAQVGDPTSDINLVMERIRQAKGS